MDKVLFFSVVLKERLWGGHTLAKRYGQTSQELLGEAWILSGHKEGETVVSNGLYKGRGLNDLYLNEKSLFGNSNYDKFPLLIKILDAKDYLSVQVHPNDSYALKHHNDYGKNECWYILDCKEDAKIIYSVKTQDKLSFKDAIDKNLWQDVLNYVEVKKDDFFDVPVGTVHAIGAGIEILEIQQSSDVTYRLYDFDRVGKDGKKRDLHIDQSLDVINYDVKAPVHNYKQFLNVNRLVCNEYFTVDKVCGSQKVTMLNNDLYTILFAKDKDALIKVDGEQVKICKDQVALLTRDIKQLDIEECGTLFLVKEKSQNLETMYQA